ncbi:MAG: hypothetical protein ABJH04_08005 [Cyclobacteriaceae bacterium]
MKHKNLILETSPIKNTDVQIGDLLVTDSDSDLLMPVIGPSDEILNIAMAFKVDQIYNEYPKQVNMCLTIIGHTANSTWKCSKRYLGKPVNKVTTNFKF